MPVELLVMFIIMGGVFVQSLAGFGSALVAMPLLTGLIGIRVAAPTFALCALVAEAVMIHRYRLELRWSSVWRLIVGSLSGIPFGIISARLVSEQFMLLLLGCVTLGYALYNLAGLRPARLQDRRWAFGFGYIAGWLSGAFNTGGPPYVIYGSSQGWTPVEFKTNLQSVFVLNSLTVISLHALNQNITGDVLRYFAVSVPALLVGLLAGFWLERYISPVAFRKGVLVLLVLVSLNLIF